MPAYVPPFRRGRVEGSSSDVPGGDRDGDYQGQQTRGPPVDEAGLYNKRDIANHFFCGEDPHRSGDTRKTAFNDSAAHPGELSPRDIHPGGTQGDALESHQKADESAAGDTITNEAANRAINDANKTDKGQFTSLEGTTSPTGASPESSVTVTNDKSGESSIPIDGLKDANASTAQPTPPASSSGRMKYTDIPTIPAEELENKGEQNAPTFPSIQPIRYIPSAHPPIAVFEEHWKPWNSARDDSVCFSFGGWYKVARVDLFAPHSAELLRMQQRTWERRDSLGRVLPLKDCVASGGKKPMDMQWAVVKFEKLADDVPPPPAIQKLPEPEFHRPSDGEAAPRGVNEMLAELRMGDSSSSKEVGARADGYEGPRETEVPGKQEAPDGVAPDLGGAFMVCVWKEQILRTCLILESALGMEGTPKHRGDYG
ncbi:hypothetical protein DL766_009582 [Monosporascus sp. MC13-8B]|uniref:Uncharacterized protein n=1 Tax=Monosporascus cannonballus TaxID=155416 RepID=A0ABY0GQY2_9PEZI|nr:hypothetical protein DL762_010290 [Monosporascus cannonballus]RYO88084.1 hypothetical protein DL763_006107 [Monosporascus cannonballus]RYP14762.1 hypothetical protein DL766_009582 [Monosporascus sp. MC13-8B]